MILPNGFDHRSTICTVYDFHYCWLQALIFLHQINKNAGLLLSVTWKGCVSTIYCHVSEGKRMRCSDSLWENQDAELNMFWAAKKILIFRFYKSLWVHTSQNISLKRQYMNCHLIYIRYQRHWLEQKKDWNWNSSFSLPMFSILQTGNHTIMMLALTAPFFF